MTRLPNKITLESLSLPERRLIALIRASQDAELIIFVKEGRPSRVEQICKTVPLSGAPGQN